MVVFRIWKPFARKQTAVPKLSYFDNYVFIVRAPSPMSKGNYMCALRSFFIVSFFLHQSPSLLRITNPIAHVFLVESVGGASIASDRGSAPRKGMERFLQPMGEGRAGPRRSGQWEARVPGTTTEPLRGGRPPRCPETPCPIRRLISSGVECSPCQKEKE